MLSLWLRCPAAQTDTGERDSERGLASRRRRLAVGTRWLSCAVRNSVPPCGTQRNLPACGTGRVVSYARHVPPKRKNFGPRGGRQVVRRSANNSAPLTRRGAAVPRARAFVLHARHVTREPHRHDSVLYTLPLAGSEGSPLHVTALKQTRELYARRALATCSCYPRAGRSQRITCV